MGRYAHLSRIRRLDPEHDHHEIYRTMALYEFPWDVRLGLNLAFYRTFAVPSIAELLDQTGELRQRPRKRADDTGLLMFEIIDHGLSHPRGIEAMRRLNRIHHRFDISNDDYLYVLGTFIFVPIRWLQRYAWRGVCCHERTASYVFYREVGRRMAIADIPPSYSEFEARFDEYEREHFRCTEASQRLMQATRSLIVARFPPALAPLAGALGDALLDDPLRQAVGVGPAPWPVRAALQLTLKARAGIERLMPPRTESVFANGITTVTYPNGYTIAELGPQ
jgi:ER-bound oxygenase mpaB/B'/Rubber oxygenase, catalytic domain